MTTDSVTSFHRMYSHVSESKAQKRKWACSNFKVMLHIVLVASCISDRSTGSKKLSTHLLRNAIGAPCIKLTY